jgi:uncharacterized phage protein (TIGR02220 family)
LKYTIEGFSQKQLIAFNLDIIDAAILRYLVDFRDSGSMLSRAVDGKQYHWVKYDAVSEALPILNLNKPDSVYRRLKKMVEQKILESVTIKQGGVYSFYRTGSNYLKLIDDSLDARSDVNPSESDENPNKSDRNPRVTDENPKESDENPEQNILLLYSSINNSSINNIYVEIVGYLNNSTGSKYRPEAKSTQRLINARLKEGYSIQDFKNVIDKKYKEWKGTEMEKYLVPDTLFGSKFEKYLNQKIINTPSNSNGKPSTFNNHSQRAFDSNIERQLLDKSLGDVDEIDTQKLLNEMREGRASNG